MNSQSRNKKRGHIRAISVSSNYCEKNFSLSSCNQGQSIIPQKLEPQFGKFIQNNHFIAKLLKNVQTNFTHYSNESQPLVQPQTQGKFNIKNIHLETGFPIHSRKQIQQSLPPTQKREEIDEKIKDLNGKIKKIEILLRTVQSTHVEKQLEALYHKQTLRERKSSINNMSMINDFCQIKSMSFKKRSRKTLETVSLKVQVANNKSPTKRILDTKVNQIINHFTYKKQDSTDSGPSPQLTQAEIHSKESDSELLSDSSSDQQTDFKNIESSVSQDTQSKQRIQLLQSIYEDRPSTIYFTCADSSKMSMRVLKLSEKEESRSNLRYKILGKLPNCLINTLRQGGLQPVDYQNLNWNFCWGMVVKDVKNLTENQKINHFPGWHHLGRKDFLWKHLRKQSRKFPSDYNFIPQTYLLASPTDWEYFQMIKERAGRNQIWIMKPVSSCQGKGIKILSKKDKILKNKCQLICEYLADPHLINGLKYDLRLYVCVTSYNPLRIYLFNEGLVRFATEKYNTCLNQLSKRYIHLTNYAVNKNNKRFINNMDANQDNIGSKWSLTAIKQWYKENGIDVKKLMRQIKDIVVKTLVSAEPFMNEGISRSYLQRLNCFEVYGFDILIDKKMKPWLLEVNARPSLACSSPLDTKVKHNLICDTLNLIGLVFSNKIQQDNVDKNRIYGWPSQVVKGATSFTNKSINQIKLQDEENYLLKLDTDDIKILFETEEENSRKGNYERLFPTPNKEQMNYYMSLFEYERYFNIIVYNWITSKKNLLETILNKRNPQLEECAVD